MRRARLTAHRWPVTVAGTGALAATGYVARAEVVAVPLLERDVPARALIGLAVVALALVPLYETFPELSTTFVREPVIRPLRAACALVLTAIGYAPGAAGAGSVDAGTADEAWQVRADATLIVLLLALGIAAVVLLGEYAWAIVLVIGLTSLSLDAVPSMPASRALLNVPPWGLVSMLALATALFARRGPRVVAVT